MQILRRLLIVGVGIYLPLSSGGANAFSLKGTLWEKASMASACKPDPLLLYSIALQESKSLVSKGMVAPQPLALRNQPRGAFFPASVDEATEALGKFISEDNLTDIGMMQINYRWNGSRVDHPAELLDPMINVSVGAEILCEAIAANRMDMLLAIGGYHTRNPRREQDARLYAHKVITIWRSLKRLARGA